MPRSARIGWLAKHSFFVIAAAAFICPGAFAQRAAVFAPLDDATALKYSAALAEKLGDSLNVSDASMSRTAFDSLGIKDPFNLTLARAKTAAAVVGCDFLVLVRGGSTRRESFEKGIYQESWAAVYVVSGRSGRLVQWELRSSSGATQEEAASALLSQASADAAVIRKAVAEVKRLEMLPVKAIPIEEMPAGDPLPDSGLRLPVPYKRIKPEYTNAAFLYGIEATVEIEADIAEDGQITRIEQARWAGFGLDESAAEAVRKMNWRPAERAGKALPMRVLLRYNFFKAAKE